jgi:hypothetical protein
MMGQGQQLCDNACEVAGVNNPTSPPVLRRVDAAYPRENVNGCGGDA